MKKKMTTAEYQNLKKFFDIYLNQTMDINAYPVSVWPITVLNEMEQTAPSRAAAGLMMAINDSIEESMSWKLDKVLAFDAELRAQGVITLTELRQQHSKQYAKVFKRGHIKNEEEYYLLKGILDGLTADLSMEEQGKLDQMIGEYETKVGMA